MGSHGGVLIFSLLLLGTLRVQADASLKDFVCKKTGFTYLYCLDRFKNMPQTVEEDLRSLGGLSISCARESVAVARKSIVDYSLNSTGDFQDAMKFCVPKLDLVLSNFASSQENWGAKRDSPAKNQLILGQQYFRDCRDKIFGYEESGEFIKEVTRVLALVKVAVSVLSLAST